MNLLNHIQTVFFALLKAQLVLSPLLFYHKRLVTRKHLAAGFLWQIQKIILLCLVLLPLFFLRPFTLNSEVPGRQTGATGLPGLLTAAASTETAFPAGESVPAGTITREITGKYSLNKLTMDITTGLRVFVNILICLSLGGLMWFLFRLFRQTRTIHGLKKEAVEIRYLQKIQIIYSRTLTTAFTSGIFKKRIFLPYDQTRHMSTHKAVLAHEINHIRQGDLIWLFLESVLFHCFWYNWFIRQLLYCGIHLRELLCDQTTARKFKSNAYLQILLQSGAKQLEPASTGFLASSWVSRQNKGFFVKRVKYLLTAGSRPGKGTKTLLVFLIACCVVMSLGAEKTPDLNLTNNEPVAVPEQTTTQPAVEIADEIPAAFYASPPFTLKLQVPMEIGQLSLEPYTTVPLLWPIPGGKDKISSNFGSRVSSFGEAYNFHRGMDIAESRGTPVLACADGIVTETGYKPERVGRFLLISHGNGFSSLYGQLDEILVNPGDTVRQGDVIGKLGSSGISTGPHLHLEIRYQDKVLDPLQLLKAGGNIIYKK